MIPQGLLRCRARLQMASWIDPIAQFGTIKRRDDQSEPTIYLEAVETAPEKRQGCYRNEAELPAVGIRDGISERRINSIFPQCT